MLFLGVPPHDIHKTKPAEFLKVIAEFSLEYRTTRERVLQQLEKKANHRERNKTRGKMIIDVSKPPDLIVQGSFSAWPKLELQPSFFFCNIHVNIIQATKDPCRACLIFPRKKLDVDKEDLDNKSGHIVLGGQLFSKEW